MKKGMAILTTFALVLSMAFSFSVSVYAADGPTNNITADWAGVFDTGTIADENALDFYGVSDSSSGGETFFTTWQDTKYDVQINSSVQLSSLRIYPKVAFGANTTVRFLFSIYVRAKPGVSKVPSFDDFTLRMVCPDGVTDLQYNWSFGTDHTARQSIVYVEGTFRVTSIFLKMIEFEGIKAYYHCDNPTVTGKMQVMFGRAYLRWWRNDVNSDGSVLEQIRQNTDKINDSVNDQGQAIQDQIADQTQKQTDELTNGYDAGYIYDSDDRLGDSLSAYEDQENQLSNEADGYINNAQFVNPGGVPQVVAGITFASSFLQTLFFNLGDWGILVMVCLSLTFGLMLVGWFRFRK